MCSRPSTSLPERMRCRVADSDWSSATMRRLLAVRLGVGAQAFEVGGAGIAAVLAQQELRAEERDEGGVGGVAERTARSAGRSGGKAWTTCRDRECKGGLRACGDRER